MDLSEMEQLVALVKQSSLSELTLRADGSRITLKKSPDGGIGVSSGELTKYVGEQGAPVDEDSLPAAFRADSTAAVDRLEPVTAPLVGIFHNTKPLIGPGAHVTTGQVIAMIEAMKLITEVASPADGTVVETLIEDGMPAEYGQTLFLVKVDA